MLEQILIIITAIHVMGMLVLGWNLVLALKGFAEVRQEWHLIVLVVLLWEIFAAERLYRACMKRRAGKRRG